MQFYLQLMLEKQNVLINYANNKLFHQERNGHQDNLLNLYILYIIICYCTWLFLCQEGLLFMAMGAFMAGASLY